MTIMSEEYKDCMISLFLFKVTASVLASEYKVLKLMLKSGTNGTLSAISIKLSSA